MRRRAVVTGAARRVGRAVALELAAHGHDVCVHYRTAAREAAEVVAACRARGADAFAVGADLQQASGCAAVVAAARERWERLDVLVNNASLYEPVPFAEITDAAWDRMLDVNLKAPFRLSRDLLPLLRAAPDGLVVHLCDIGAERPVRGYAHYSVSKAGLVMLVKAMAVELAPEVRAVGISPGQVAWPPSYGPERREAIARRIPMGRAGTPEDVARLVRFAALEGGYLNGAVIPVDGGLSARY